MSMSDQVKDFDKAKAESLKGSYLVFKPDPLLLMRDNMKITQMRFFEAYLSKIDASDPSTYKVKIPLDKVAELANVDLSNRKEVERMCEGIESSRFDFKKYRERYEPESLDPKRKILRDTFPLFDRFTLVNEDGEYYIEVIPGVTMTDMLQQYQRNYATYQLQEIYSLSSKTTMRMYSCFKRLQTFGTTKIGIDLLKTYLGIEDGKYKRNTDFRKYILEPGVKEINECTDINVTYKPYRKKQNLAGWSFTITAKADGERREGTEPPISGDYVDVTEEMEFVDDYSENPLEKSFFSESERLEYIERYLDSEFMLEHNKELLECLPENVHEFEEANVMGIRNAALELRPSHVKEEDKEMWIMTVVGRYNVQEWYPKKAPKVKYKAYSYYLDGFKRWLKASFGQSKS